jgi:protein-disulfide isomerase
VTRSNVPPTSRRERRAQSRLERPAGRTRISQRSSGRPRWQSPLVLVSAGAVLIAIAVIFFAPRPAGTNGDLFIPPMSYPNELVDGDTIGSETAPVVIELYSDFQCPACKTFVTQQLSGLVRDFVKTGVARIEAVDIDIIGRGTGSQNESLELAAGAACAAEQGRYWQFHDIVFWNQGGENVGDHDTEFIRRVATAAEVDRTAWDACFARTDNRQPFVDQTQAALALGVSSTPTLRINGQPWVGVKQYEQLSALITSLAAAAATAAPPTEVPATAAPS